MIIYTKENKADRSNNKQLLQDEDKDDLEQKKVTTREYYTCAGNWRSQEYFKLIKNNDLIIINQSSVLDSIEETWEFTLLLQDAHLVCFQLDNITWKASEL